jgi:hypothetical protein
MHPSILRHHLDGSLWTHLRSSRMWLIDGWIMDGTAGSYQKHPACVLAYVISARQYANGRGPFPFSACWRLATGHAVASAASGGPASLRSQMRRPTAGDGLIEHWAPKDRRGGGAARRSDLTGRSGAAGGQVVVGWIKTMLPAAASCSTLPSCLLPLCVCARALPPILSPSSVASSAFSFQRRLHRTYSCRRSPSPHSSSRKRCPLRAGPHARRHSPLGPHSAWPSRSETTIRTVQQRPGLARAGVHLQVRPECTRHSLFLSPSNGLVRSKLAWQFWQTLFPLSFISYYFIYILEGTTGKYFCWSHWIGRHASLWRRAY